MLLDLSRIRTPQERFEQVYPSEAFAEDREDFRVSAPVSLHAGRPSSWQT